MRWVVTGASGMLGAELVALLGARGEQVLGLRRADLDLTDPAAVAGVAADADVLVNCAAWTAVDAAEAHEAEAFAVNAAGAGLLAREAGVAGALMVQLSTDYVVAGGDPEPRRPLPEDVAIAPRSAYGRTKAAGEWAVRALAPRHLVVRTAWLYGAHGPCFPRTIAALARERGRLEVVDDQRGQPTWALDVADLIHRLVRADPPSGVYHATSSGDTSWYGFARAVVRSAGLDPDLVTAVDTGSRRPAPRPSWSVLGHDALARVGVAPIGDWQDRWATAAPTVLGPA